MQHHIRPAGLPPVNGYSHCVVATGNVIHVSGQVPMDADGRLVGAGDVGAQTEQVFHNLVTALGAAGAGFADVVKLTYFLTDLAHLDEVRRVRDRHLDPARPPASSLVQVSGLVDPRFLIEIDAVAVR